MASADTQARVTVDIEKYVAQLEKRVAEQEQLIALLNDKVARYESEGVASQSYAGAVRRDRSHGSRTCAAVSGGSAVAVGDVRTADSFQIIGSKKTDISSVPSVRYSQIFVTRINPDISAKELGEDLRSGAPELSSVKCSKLKTKYDSYASFHIIVPEAEKVLISSEEVWPEGALVKLFSGKLLKSHVTDYFNSDSPDKNQMACSSRGNVRPVAAKGSQSKAVRGKSATATVPVASTSVAVSGASSVGAKAKPKNGSSVATTASPKSSVVEMQYEISSSSRSRSSITSSSRSRKGTLIDKKAI
ncbi:hypothetical protein M8J76_005102 [Diaphorina citri]|nr:hypothetical protein M8J76_005102 [Diaphorina citri]